MKTMFIYEPAKPTVAGTVNAEIEESRQRLTHVIGRLKQFGVTIVRYNLKHHPDEFMMNFDVSNRVRSGGQKCLPITIVNGRVMKQGSYPTNQEIIQWLEVPTEFVEDGCNSDCCGGGCSGCGSHE